jgi:flagellar hook-length control protein FliK
LVQVLGDHLQLQIGRGSESAVIRLDPPSMGSIEIVIRHEAGGVQVHLSASNGEVLNQLQGIGDALRQDLMQRHQGAVSVQVSDDSANAGRRQRQPEGQDESEPSVREAADDEEPATFSLA